MRFVINQKVKNFLEWGVVAHAYNASIQDAEARILLIQTSLGYWVFQGQPGIQSETLSLKKQNKTKVI